MKVFEKYRTFSGKLDGSPKGSFHSHHIPILNFIFCHGSNNLILGFSDFIRILKKWVQDIWNYIFLHFFGNLMISTCPKGFGLKLAKLGLKIPLKSQAEPS